VTPGIKGKRLDWVLELLDLAIGGPVAMGSINESLKEHRSLQSVQHTEDSIVRETDTQGNGIRMQVQVTTGVESIVFNGELKQSRTYKLNLSGSIESNSSSIVSDTGPLLSFRSAFSNEVRGVDIGFIGSCAEHSIGILGGVFREVKVLVVVSLEGFRDHASIRTAFLDGTLGEAVV